MTYMNIVLYGPLVGFQPGIGGKRGIWYNSMALIFKAFLFNFVNNARHELGASSCVRK